MTDTTVKFFHSAMTGAPVLSGTAGSLIAVLDACLVNGFAVSSVNSLVVASNVATATISGGHSAEVGSVVLVSGATPSGLNGEKKVLSVGGGNTTLTYDATGIGNQTATGSISLKLSPAGWSKTYSGTNLAAYKSNNVVGTACLLRVDDTNAKYCRCIGYETMTAISTGSGRFPTSTMFNGGVYWTKSTVADSSARPWVVVADDRFFYLLVHYHPTYPIGGQFVGFGDFLKASSTDAWACALTGYAGSFDAIAPGSVNDYGTAAMVSVGQNMYFPRSYAATGSSVQASRNFPQLVPTNTSSVISGSGLALYPNGGDYGLYLSTISLYENDLLAHRGLSPGLYCCSQKLPLQLFAPKSRIAAVDNLIGRELLVEPFGAGTGTAAFAFFDLTGPWR